VRIVEDEALVARVKAEGVTLEMCPSSNVLTRVVDRFEDHPLPRLLAEGLKVTVNSDDPPMFNTDLTTEFVRLHQAFGLGEAEVRQLSLNAIDATFLPAPEKAALRARFDAAWAQAAEPVGA
jgi:adenosine deaminase